MPPIKLLTESSELTEEDLQIFINNEEVLVLQIRDGHITGEMLWDTTKWQTVQDEALANGIKRCSLCRAGSSTPPSVGGLERAIAGAKVGASRTPIEEYYCDCRV